MRDEERAGIILKESCRHRSPHLMLHLAETQNTPIPSTVLLTDTQSLWSHIRPGNKVRAQNRQCAFPLTFFLSSCDMICNMRGYNSD